MLNVPKFCPQKSDVACWSCPFYLSGVNMSLMQFNMKICGPTFACRPNADIVVEVEVEVEVDVDVDVEVDMKVDVNTSQIHITAESLFNKMNKGIRSC